MAPTGSTPRRIPVPSGRRNRTSSSASSSSRKSASDRRSTPTENSPTQVASGLGEGSPAAGSSTKVYARPQPPSRTPRKTPTRQLKTPTRTMSTPTRSKNDAPALLTPEPEKIDMPQEDGAPYGSRGEALFEKVWEKYDPNQLGSIKASDLVDVLSRIEVDGNLARNSINPTSISGPLNDRVRGHRTSTLTRAQVRDWYRDASNGKDLLAEIEKAVDRAARPVSPMSLGGFGGLSQMSGFPLGANDMSYNPIDDLDQPTGPFVGVSTPRRPSPASGPVLSPRMAALQVPPRMYSEAEYEHLRKENERLLAEMEESTAHYESKVKDREDQLSSLETHIASKEKQITLFQKTIEDLTTECQKQKERAEKADDHIKYVEGHVEKLQKLVNQHKSVVDDANERVKKAEVDVGKKDTKISQLSLEISSLKNHLEERETMYRKAHNEGYQKAKEEFESQAMSADEATQRVAEAEYRADLKDENNAILKKRNQEARFKIDDLEKQVAELGKLNSSLSAEVKDFKRKNASITASTSAAESIDNLLISPDDGDDVFAPRGDEYLGTKPYIGRKGRIQRDIRMDLAGRDVQTNLTIAPFDEEGAVSVEEFVEDPYMASVQTLRLCGDLNDDEHELRAIAEEASESEEPTHAEKKDLKEASTETDAARASESAVQTTPLVKAETTDSATDPKSPEPEEELIIAHEGMGTNMLGITTSTKLTPRYPVSTSSAASSTTSSYIKRRTSKSASSNNSDTYTETITTTPAIASSLKALLSRNTLTLSDVQKICTFISSQPSNTLLAACWQLSRPTEKSLRRILLSSSPGNSSSKALTAALADGEQSRSWGWAAKMLLPPQHGKVEEEDEEDDTASTASIRSAKRSTTAAKTQPPSRLRTILHYLLLAIFAFLLIHNLYQYHLIHSEQHLWSIANRVDSAWGGGIDANARPDSPPASSFPASSSSHSDNTASGSAKGAGWDGVGRGCYRVCDGGMFGGEGLLGWRWRGILWEWVTGGVD